MQNSLNLAFLRIYYIIRPLNNQDYNYMIRDVGSYIGNRTGVLNSGPSRERPNKFNWVPKMSNSEIREIADSLHIKPGIKFLIREGVKKVAPGIGEVKEVRSDGIVLFTDAQGIEFKIASNSPLFREENIVE